jgi:TPR repeat protein
MSALADCYHRGQLGLQQDQEMAMELWKKAAELGSSLAHFELGIIYDERGDLKKAKVHYETAAMAGHELARHNVGIMENKYGNMERALKHWIIAAPAGHYNAMRNMLVAFNKGLVSRNAIESSLRAYNTSCAEMRSEARDAYINMCILHREVI